MVMLALSIVFAGTQECGKIQYSFDFERPPKKGLCIKTLVSSLWHDWEGTFRR